MKARELRGLGVPDGHSLDLAVELVQAHGKSQSDRAAASALRETLRRVAESPEDFLEDAELGRLAAAIVAKRRAVAAFVPRAAPAPYRQWGADLEPTSVQQMENACGLPVAVRGALMPDAHLGYGLPIGGVLATRNAVIPYAVGVDIACRMKMTVLDLPPATLDEHPNRLEDRDRARDPLRHRGALQGAASRARRDGRRLDRHARDRAAQGQGLVAARHQRQRQPLRRVRRADSRSRGELRARAGRLPGAAQPQRQPRRRRDDRRATTASWRCDQHPELPRELAPPRLARPRHRGGPGVLAGDGADGRATPPPTTPASTATIAEHLGAEVLLDVENHHNFAWKEEHDGEQLIVHRKGATPAGDGVLGIIPGSMATPTYVVRGKGNDGVAALRGPRRRPGDEPHPGQEGRSPGRRRASCSHERGVTLLSAGLDEVPMVYKDIDAVMARPARSGRADRRASSRGSSRWRRRASGRRTEPPQSR